MLEFRRSYENLPDDWKESKIGEIFERVTQRNVGCNTNVLTVSAQHGLVSQREFFRRQVASENLRTYTLLRQGDFAYNKSYSVGYPLGVIRRLERYQSGVVSPLYICFRLCSNDCDSGFLTHYFEAGLLDEALAIVAQEGIRNHGLLNVGVRDFFGLGLRLPSYREQCRIAEILDTLDKAIQKTDQLIVKLKQVKQGLLHDLLTRGIDENGELRDPERHPEQFKRSPLGRIPKEWEPVSLDSVLTDIRYGISVAANGQPGDIPILRIPNVEAGELDFKDLKYLRASDRDLERFGVFQGDILVIRTNGNPSILGACAHVDRDLGRCVFASYLIRLRVRVDCVDPRYVTIFVNSRLGRSYIDRQVATSAGNYNINAAQLRAFPILCPSRDEQDRVVEYLHVFDAKIKEEVACSSKLRLLKQGLMEDLLIGRVRVTPLLTESTP